MNFRSQSIVIILFIMIAGCQKKEQTLPEADESAICTIELVELFDYAALPARGNFENRKIIIDKFWAEIAAQQIPLAGSNFFVYYNLPENTPAENLIWEIGIPVPPEIEIRLPLVKKMWQFSTVARAACIGPSEKTFGLFPKMIEYIEEQKMMRSGPVMERYLSDPRELADDSLQIEIWIPAGKTAIE